MSEVTVSLKEQMEKTIIFFKSELKNVRTGRATTSMLDSIRVEAYGTPTELIGIATIAIPEPKLITIQPWDTGLIPAIEKAITSSDFGINPANDGKIIRLPIPALNEERRKDLVKQVGRMGEDTKVTIRNERRNANEIIKKLQKDSEISEDDSKKQQDEVQKLTDTFTKQIDELVKIKEKEILEL